MTGTKTSHVARAVAEAAKEDGIVNVLAGSLSLGAPSLPAPEVRHE